MVTGGAGYIGSVVADVLRAAGHDVIIVDEAGSPDLRVPSLRVQDAAELLDPSFDAVLHFAAYIAAGESVTQPLRYWENNFVGSLALIRAMHQHGVRRLVFSSTANVYGDPDEPAPIPETAPTRPPNPYAGSKLAVDHLLRDAAVAYGFAATSLRYFNVAGAHRGANGQLIGERHDPETHLIPIALDVAAGRRDRFTIFGDDYPTPDGTCVRDYLHVSDLADAHVLALDALVPGVHRIFNLGNGQGYSNREVVDVVRGVTGAPVPIEIGPRRPGDPAVLVASAERARGELGWRPTRTSLAEIVSDAWEFYRA